MRNKEKFSIRKYKIGVASVLVGLGVAIGESAVEAHAANTTDTAVTQSGLGKQSSKKLTGEELIKHRNASKEELNKTGLSEKRKEEYRKKIDTEDDFDKLLELDNKFHEESRLESLKNFKNDKAKNFAKGLMEEIKYQKEKINKMKSLTEEERKNALENLEKIEKEAIEKLSSLTTDAQINKVRYEVIKELSKPVVPFKFYVEKELNDYANKKLESLGEVHKQNLLTGEESFEADYNNLVEKLKKIRLQAFDRIDKATKKDEILKIKKETETEIDNAVKAYQNNKR